MNLAGWTVSVGWAPQTGVTSSGDPVYAAATTIQARVQAGKDRNYLEIDHTDQLLTSAPVAVDDRLWMPGDSTSDNTLARRAKHVRSAVSPADGSTMTKVLL